MLIFGRSRRPCGGWEEAASRNVGWNQDIPVPSDQDGLHVRVEVRYRLNGQLRRILLRSPRVALVVTYEDGFRGTYRFLPALARSGLWIGHLPHNLNGVQALLAGKPLPAVRSIRVVSDFPDSFVQEIPVRFARFRVGF